MLYSYDVFDTLITRRTATPKGIFALMKNCLEREYPDVVKRLCGDFYELRVIAEESAHAAKDVTVSEEITINDIYKALQQISAISDEDIDLLIQLEYKTEVANAVGIYENINDVRKKIEDGERIVLISDMYLKREQIQNILISVDPIFENITLYVSSELKRTKGSGNLFWCVKEREFVHYHSWTHIGDNAFSDVEVPKRLGIITNKYEAHTLTECEKKILETNEKNPAVQLFIGSAKRVRAKLGNQLAVKLGTTYGAAIITWYSDWIMKICEVEGINDIFFVARDGEIVMKVAEKLVQNNLYNKNLHYIYGSRKAWRVINIGDEECYDVQRYLESAMNDAAFSIEEAASYLGLETEYLCEILGCDICDSGRKEVWKNLCEGNVFRELNAKLDLKTLLLKRNHAKSELLKKYLEQELVESDRKVLFADLVGSGMTQDMVASFVKKYLKKDIVSTLFSKSYMINSENRFYTCMGIDKEKASVVEALTRSLCGKTDGYEVVNDKVVPIIVEDDNTRLVEYGYPKYLEAVLLVVENYLEAVVEFKLDSINLCGREYYRYLIEEEEGDLLSYICSTPMSNCFFGKEQILEFAPLISDQAIEDVAQKGYIDILSSNLFFSKRRSGLNKDKRIDEQLNVFINNLVIKEENTRKKEREALMQKKHHYVIMRNMLKNKIALYGAGDVGSCLYDSIRKFKETEIVVWVDKNFTEKEGIKDNANNLVEYEFDQVVVAVRDWPTYVDIRCKLTEMGIKNELIYWEDYQLIMD